MGSLSELEPKAVFRFFEEISAIPHGSGNTDALADHLVRFAEKRHFKAHKDEAGNVIIPVPGSPGFESAPVVMLQGHMDMVCERLSDSRHNFLTDPLKLGWMDDDVFAYGTTLGADDGIAIAFFMAILDDPDLPHPPLEIILTTDEEIGMGGARALNTSRLHAKYMLNLDCEEEGILLASSAGGLIANMSVPIRYTKKRGEKYKIVVSGFQGGHSGTEIGKYHGNANIIMGRLLHFLNRKLKYDIISLQGGLMHNAIPRDADCRVLISREDSWSFEDLIREFEATIQNEYRANEKNIMIYCDHMGQSEEEVLYRKTKDRVIFLLNTVPDGVQKVSQEKATEGLVETSLNIGIMRMGEKAFYLDASLRSSISSAKYALSDKLRFLTETIGGTYVVSGDYPAWEFNEDSPLMHRMIRLYKEEFGTEPRIAGLHAGFECGIFFEKMPLLDIVSFGPQINGIHTPAERLSISSVQNTWKYLLRVLASFGEPEPEEKAAPGGSSL